MRDKLNELKTRLAELYDLGAAAALLSWDQATYLPPAAAQARGQQLATLARLRQERATDPDLGGLLEDLEQLAQDLDYDSDDASLLRVARRDFDRAVRVPPEFLARFSAHSAESFQLWAAARPNDDFDRVRPGLEKTLELSLEYSSFFPEADHPADPHIADSDFGMTVAEVQPLFANLRSQLVPVVEAIASQPAADRGPIEQEFPEADQLAFGQQVIQDFGFDFNRGRQDKTHHPFMTRFSIDDVRITTRVKSDDLSEALFSTLHEAGHALYELGIDPALARSPLARGTSSGMHESQSRLWENYVGRSYPFWQHYYPALQAQFPNQLGQVDMDAFYAAVNSVQRSLIRTDADEVTYNLHVMIRFDLELALLEGELEVRHLPQAWHDQYDSALGVTSGDDRNGVMQDVHWYAGGIGGAFQGYTLGNIMAAQLYDTAVKAEPDIPGDIAGGKFDRLHGWMKAHVYRHGRKFTANEILERATGSPLTIDPYMAYLRGKFEPLYGIE